MNKYLLILFVCLSFSACGQTQIRTPENAMTKFEEFKKKEKFVEESTFFYPGITNPNMRPALTEKINKAADDFRAVAEGKNPTDKEYQNKIEVGLVRFSDVYMNLDTEDRERICTYFEELIDIVGLESSGGHLMKFMYGFSLPESSGSEE
ncbi:DUF4844 domain-containing protein [Pontibacter sp. E15-1]|uniref:DUF4844 domain-containing protein n=1 Tax=Pontibacter sp. E15-1 TaxID=2919918 RepID=UPI001F503000|nr:DUF4844 domain-containing protein [Pontibacter sp. E15-1]MCJ8167105.1 DUF4844 domain-containing protein [Pontibacter sp. E15-1]